MRWIPTAFGGYRSWSTVINEPSYTWIIRNSHRYYNFTPDGSFPENHGPNHEDQVDN